MDYVKILMDHHPQAILWHIWETSRHAEFFCCWKITPGIAKTVFENPKGPPFRCWKKKSSNQSHVMAFGLMILKWLLVIANIFCKYMVKNIFQNIFSNFLKKYFQYLSVIPFWNRETKCHHMALIKSWFEELFFQHGGIRSSVFGNFSWMKIFGLRSSVFGNFSSTKIFGLQYSEIFHERRYSVFGIHE